MTLDGSTLETGTARRIRSVLGVGRKGLSGRCTTSTTLCRSKASTIRFALIRPTFKVSVESVISRKRPRIMGGLGSGRRKGPVVPGEWLDRACACGRRFQTWSRTPRRFCSPECGRASTTAAARARAPQQRKPRPPCQQCGIPLKRLPNGTSHYGRFCSRQCSGKYKTARRLEREATKVQPLRPGCVWCGDTYQKGKRYCENCRLVRTARVCVSCGQDSGARKTCSPLCRSLYLKARLTGKKYKPATLREFTCARCASTFHAVRTQKRICQRCAKRAFRQGKGKFRERCKRAGVLYDSKVTAQAVFMRDHWHCHLCGRSTPARLRGRNQPSSPEVDHILPITKGGGHTWDNVACACRECNGNKSDKPLGQLRLAV